MEMMDYCLYQVDLEGDVFELNFCNYVPKKNHEFLIITNEKGKDVTDYVLTKAGPFGNFLGKEITPCQIGFQKLYINEREIKDNEIIPDLTSFQ
jgi:hypothetical protein